MNQLLSYAEHIFGYPKREASKFIIVAIPIYKNDKQNSSMAMGAKIFTNNIILLNLLGIQYSVYHTY